MGQITVFSGLDGFQMVDRITHLGDRRICGCKRFFGTPRYAGLEAMAQLAALHARYILDFKRHAFLLKITLCRLPAAGLLDGSYLLEADLLEQSSRAFAYRIEGRRPDEFRLQAELLIGTRNYDERFKQAILEPHYRKMMACLHNATGLS
jgi:hypothetical protein